MAEELKGRGLGSLLAAWRDGAFDRLREMVMAAKPAPNGHVNLIVKQTPRGWVAAANPRGGGGAGVRFFRADLEIDPDYPDFPEPANIRDVLNDLYDPTEAEPITPRIGDSVILYVDTSATETPQMRPRLIYTVIAGPGGLNDFPEASTRLVWFNPTGGANSAGFAAVMTQTGIW